MGDVVNFDPNRKVVVNNLNIDRQAIILARKKKALVRKVKKTGALVLLATTIVAGMLSCGRKGTNEPGPSQDPIPPVSIEATIDDLSSLNVVLVDDGIDDSKINKAADELNEMGLDVEVRDIDNLNSAGIETFIALKEYGGDNTKVICNYNNGNNHADLLALAMSCETNGTLQRGVNEVGVDITRKVPSNIENNVDRIIPTVTLAVPEDKDIDTSIIVDGLARYNHYFKEGNIHDANFLTRGETSIYSLKEKYGDNVLRLNGIDINNNLDQDQVLVIKKLSNCLDRDVEVTVHTSKSNEFNK